MHAFLLIGKNPVSLRLKAQSIANKVNSSIIDFPLSTIEDVRALNNILRLSFNKPTLIYSTNIDNAGEEALNAFLKNLEEPQENIYFALTASSAQKVLPTIASRTQIIKLKDNKNTEDNFDEIIKFLKMDKGEKINLISQIKDREQAIKFAEDMVYFIHRSIHENKVQYNVTVKNSELALKTLARLKANGNINLQLSNFVIQYEE